MKKRIILGTSFAFLIATAALNWNQSQTWTILAETTFGATDSPEEVTILTDPTTRPTSRDHGLLSMIQGSYDHDFKEPIEKIASSVLTDTIDNDGDGEVDEADEIYTVLPTEWCDGVDSDNDGVIDNYSEFSGRIFLQLTDGIDNDGDGIIDEIDEILVRPLPQPLTDGIDNDEDGIIDEEDEAIHPTHVKHLRFEDVIHDEVDNDFDGEIDETDELWTLFPVEWIDGNYSDNDGVIDNYSEYSGKIPFQLTDTIDNDSDGQVDEYDEVVTSSASSHHKH